MDKLTKTEEYLWAYIENNINKVPKMSIVDLSNEANVSSATVVRTLKKMGYEGFTGFKYELKKQKSNLNFEGLDDADNNIKRAIEKNHQETVQTIQRMRTSLIEDAVKQVESSKRVIILSRGLSTYVAEELQLRLNVLDKYCESYSDPNIIKLKSKSFSQEDVVIIISLNGKTEELVYALKNCNDRDITTISFTTQKNSFISQYSSLNFVGYRTIDTFIPEYEVKSRLPLTIMTRIFSDAYAVRTVQKQD